MDGNKDDNHGVSRCGGGFDCDNNGKEDEKKEDDDIGKDSAVAAALANQRVRAMVEGRRGVTGHV